MKKFILVFIIILSLLVVGGCRKSKSTAEIGNEYDLDIEIEETFAKQALQDEYSQEFELQRGQFVTDLNGEKEIDIYDLLYQSVILALPNKKVCGINCNEDMFMSDENYHEHDSRMDIFKNIQIERKD